MMHLNLLSVGNTKFELITLSQLFHVSQLDLLLDAIIIQLFELPWFICWQIVGIVGTHSFSEFWIPMECLHTIFENKTSEVNHTFKNIGGEFADLIIIIPPSNILSK